MHLAALRRLVIVGGLALCGHAVTAGDPPQATSASPVDSTSCNHAMAKAVEYLKSTQDPATGGWCISDKAPVFPAITGLALSGMIGSGVVDARDASVQAAVKFILARQQPDGGIYEGILPSYNTAICLTALAMAPDLPGVDEARRKAVAFLRGIQNGEEATGVTIGGDAAKSVGRDHPFYGGIGYGKHGRPDLSNTSFFVEALHASGVKGDDPAMQRAMVFLQRVQMLERSGEMVVNDMAYARGSRQGGFVYATSENKDKVGSGQSFAGEATETLSDGTVASRLRSYGSMSYAGFKSYLYAGLSKDDPRVVAAMEWIGRHYTLDENPGVGTDGLYYYYLVFARAMAANGSPTVEVVDSLGGRTVRRWRDDLCGKLRSLQQPDGSFRSVDDRWMEDNPVLITAYALNALSNAK